MFQKDVSLILPENWFIQNVKRKCEKNMKFSVTFDVFAHLFF